VQLEGLDKARGTSAVVEAPIKRPVFDVDGLKAGVKERFGRGDILTGVGVAQLEVFDSDDGKPLRAGLLISELNAGHEEQNPLVVKAPVFFDAVELTIWSCTPEDGHEATLEKFESEKAFQDFVAGRKLQHRKMQDGKVVKLGTIKSLGEAFKASQAEGTYLVQGNSLREQVDGHEGFITNHASGIEQQTTRMIASGKSEALEKLYGELSLVNEGESVTFIKRGTDDKYLECDGLVKNSITVLLNEAKSAPQDEHIESLTNPKVGKVVKLEAVLNNPDQFTSIPAGAIKELQGLKHVVPVLSGFFFEHNIMQKAQNSGIHCVRTNGNGYIFESALQ